MSRTVLNVIEKLVAIFHWHFLMTLLSICNRYFKITLTYFLANVVNTYLIHNFGLVIAIQISDCVQCTTT